MASALYLIQAPGESLKTFNTRVRTECLFLESPVQFVDLAVVDGRPMVKLFSVPREELIAEAEEDADDADDGEEVDEKTKGLDGAVVASVVLLRANSPRAVETTEKRLDKVFANLAGEDVVEDLCKTVVGDHYEWISNEATGEKLYLPVKVVYELIVWEAPPEAFVPDEGTDDDSADGDDSDEDAVDEDVVDEDDSDDDSDEDAVDEDAEDED